MFTPREAADATYEPTTGVWFVKDATQADGVARIDVNNADAELRDFTTLAALAPFINTERVRLVHLSPADYASFKSGLATGALMRSAEDSKPEDNEENQVDPSDIPNI